MITITNLFKIFGPKSPSLIKEVKAGMTKQELLDKHNHVLGLNNINLSFHEKSIEVVMGLSGSGKSTLIRHVNRLLEPTHGEISIDGENILEFNKAQLRSLRQSKISMVFQKFALLPHRTIFENITFGLEIQGGKASEFNEKAHFWLERVGLKGFEDNTPKQLSGGMQQRVGLARALATDAKILLMDEAFSALDPLIRTEMQDMLLGLQQEFEKTIIFITHDLDEALKIGDRIAILNEGNLIQQGESHSILINPEDDYVQKFVANVNRAKVLKVKSIMTKLNGSQINTGDSPMTVNSSDTAEDVLNTVVLRNPSFIWVEDNSGKQIGYLKRADLAETIGRDKKFDNLPDN